MSPSVAFGCLELLGIVIRNEVTPAGALSLSIGPVPPRDILVASFEMRWLGTTEKGLLAIAPRGERALAARDDRTRIKILALDYIEAVNPPWLQIASAGRRELLLQAPNGMCQLLVEAGLAYGDEPESVEFWDTLAAMARGIRSVLLTEVGRIGERLSLAHEHARTGYRPK